MERVESTLNRLRADAAGGELAVECSRLGIDLLVLFGSASTDASRAGDVDVAYARVRRAAAVDHIDVVNALGERYGDLVDVLDLDAAGSVARFEALRDPVVLFEGTPDRFAEDQLAAFGVYRDTQRFRDLAVQVLAG